MTFRYVLPQHWIDKVSHEMEEFANGGAQVTIKTKSGDVFEKVLISNSMWIVAARGYKDLPFAVEDIVEIYQTDEDKNPSQRGNWDFWDEWPEPGSPG
jgi:hypothetical protein